MPFTQNNYFFMDVNTNIRNVKCLNCHEILQSKFCPNCGQSIKTHRFSLKLFFKEVFINGVFQIDKGFFYTFKELFIRPGHSIRAYVDGSRVNHFNYFTFIVLLITIGHLLTGALHIELIDATHYFSQDQSLLKRFGEITREYPKLFTFLKIPFLSVVSMVIFRKARLHYTEHLVLNIYKLSAEIIIAIFFTLLSMIFTEKYTYVFPALVAGLSVLYSIWFYYQYFSVYGYSKPELFARSMIATLLLFMLAAAISTFVIGVQDGFNDVK